ncbi:MAG: flagellar biosynthesis anti-sigma factor FlgM [Betaproteobacteria bacterium]
MKITPSTTGSRSEAAGQASPATDRKTGGAAAPVAGIAEQDTIKLSPLSSELAALEASLAANGDFDTAKVDAIRQAILDGTLSVDSGAIADKMLAAAAAWLGKKNA